MEALRPVFRKIRPSPIEREPFNSRAPSLTVIGHWTLSGQMRSKAYSALTAPLVLHHTRIYKCAMKKFVFSWQMRNEPFFIVIYHSSLVKGAMNAARVCKLCNCVKKPLNFFYFQWPKVDQVRSEYLRSYLNWLHNWHNRRNRRRSHTLQGSHSMGDGRIYLKTGFL